MGFPQRRNLLTVLPTSVGTGSVVAIGQASETDLAQALTRIKIKTIGQVSETDLAQGLTRLKQRAVAQVTETDLAQAVTRLKRKAALVRKASGTSLLRQASVGHQGGRCGGRAESMSSRKWPSCGSRRVRKSRSAFSRSGKHSQIFWCQA